jgi:hypothetical protein
MVCEAFAYIHFLPSYQKFFIEISHRVRSGSLQHRYYIFRQLTLVGNHVSLGDCPIPRPHNDAVYKRISPRGWHYVGTVAGELGVQCYASHIEISALGCVLKYFAYGCRLILQRCSGKQPAGCKLRAWELSKRYWSGRSGEIVATGQFGWRMIYGIGVGGVRCSKS